MALNYVIKKGSCSMELTKMLIGKPLCMFFFYPHPSLCILDILGHISDHDRPFFLVFFFLLITINDISSRTILNCVGFRKSLFNF